MIQCANRMERPETRSPSALRVHEIVNELLARKFARLVIEKHEETVQVELTDKERLAVK